MLIDRPLLLVNAFDIVMEMSRVKMECTGVGSLNCLSFRREDGVFKKKNFF